MLKFFIRNKRQTAGTANLAFRIQKRKPHVDMLFTTSIKVDVQTFNDGDYSSDVRKAMEEVSALVEGVLNEVESNDDREVIETVLQQNENRKAYELKKAIREYERETEERKESEIATFCASYIDSLSDGSILSAKGAVMAETSIKSFRTFLKHFTAFDGCRGTTFDELTDMYVKKFKAFLKRNHLLGNSINKMLAIGARLTNAAIKSGKCHNLQTLGYWEKIVVNKEATKAKPYLTTDELDALYSMPLAGTKARVRDIFVFQCLILQRFSDVVSLSKMNFKKSSSGRDVIILRQKKTAHEVHLPILDERVMIIANRLNYDFQMNVGRFNKAIKSILRDLSATVPSLRAEYTGVLSQKEVERDAHVNSIRKKQAAGMELTASEEAVMKRFNRFADEEGNRYHREGEYVTRPKWDLIASHSARRSGVTNLLKSRRLPADMIMLVSGHSSKSSFDLYNRMTADETSDMIAETYEEGAKVVPMRTAN